MANVNYNSLKMQTYFKSSELNEDEKRTIFKYRVRMENFGENYRGGASAIPCPLCNTHLDSQDKSFQCPIIRRKIEVRGNINNIFKEEIDLETVKTIHKISKYRKNTLENVPSI